VRVTGTHVDITQNKKAELDLLLFKSIVECSNMAIAISDPNGQLYYINPAHVKLFGRTLEEARNLNYRDYYPLESLEILSKEVAPALERGSGWEGELEVFNINGRVFPLWEQADSIFDESGNMLFGFGIMQDITKRKQAEAQIKSSLKEKETLLQEIHHRVKNNMTVISSLLKLQMNSLDNKEAKEALQDSQNRVQSMSMIHETLYRSDNLSAIDLKTYLSELGGTIFQNYSISNKVQFKVEAENITIGAKQASPVGLIVNELISNCLKYAFTDDREGEILLKLKSNNENGVELIVSDNGVGIPEAFDLQKADSLGLKLVKMLAENQLDGSLDMESNNGTKFTIKFNTET
jgi:PAS domain S-box-containing protein